MTTDSRLRTPAGESAMDEVNDAVRVNVVTGSVDTGLTTGSGATDATTLRTVSATDDAAVSVLGATTDAAVATDTTGTVSGKLRGLVKMLASVWDSTLSVLKVDFSTPSAADSTAYAASLVVKASAGTLYELTGYNSGAAQFIQLHDAASLPADATAPKIVFLVPAQSNFSWTAKRGRSFASGIVACNSSTGATKTAGAANCWFSALYR